MSIYSNNKKIKQVSFELEQTFEDEIINNYKLFFGEKSLWIPIKKKLSTETLGGVIPDGFLINFADVDNIEFYIVEVELNKHHFFNHIFPQITKFIAFFRTDDKQKTFIEQLYNIIDTNENLRKTVLENIGNKELYKFINDLIKKSQNILLIIDKNKPEIDEIMTTYPATWGEMVKVIVITKYDSNGTTIFSMDPEFEELEYLQRTDEGKKSKNSNLTEEEQLKSHKCSKTDLYFEIKKRLQQINPDIIFNPQKYYISVRNNKNLLYIWGQTKQLRIVIMLEEEIVRKTIKNCRIGSLSSKVQSFYNGSCVSIYMENTNQIDEFIDTVKPLIEA